MRQMQNRPLRPGAVRRTREGGSLYNPCPIVYNRGKRRDPAPQEGNDRMKHRYWIFDMDGTLTDSMPIWAEVPYELVRGFGRTPAPDLGRVLLPMSALETAQYLITTYDLPLTIDSYTRAAMDAVDRLYRGVSLKPGVRQVLDRLESQGARMCVCSATWQFMCERVLGRLGVLDKFQFVLTAGDGNSKHQPAVFYQALSRMGGRDPAQCVVCEDALYAARTAHDAGFTVIGVADASSAPDEKAIRAVSSQFLTSWSRLDWARV